MDKISHFRNNHPNIKIKLTDLSTAELIESLEKRRIDFIVDSLPIDTIYNNITIKPICTLNTTFIKSVYDTTKISSLKDLEDKCLILPIERSSLRKTLNKCFKEAGVKGIPKLEFGTEELIIDSVRRNMGIGYVVKDAVKYLVDQNILSYVSLNEELPKMELNLVYVNSYLTKVANMFIKEEITDEDEFV